MDIPVAWDRFIIQIISMRLRMLCRQTPQIGNGRTFIIPRQRPYPHFGDHSLRALSWPPKPLCLSFALTPRQYYPLSVLDRLTPDLKS